MLVIPIYNTIILPQIQYHLAPNLLTEAEIEKLKKEQHVILLPLKEWKERPSLTREDFHSVGLVSEVRSIKMEEEGAVLAVETKERVDILELEIGEEELSATYRIRNEIVDVTEEEEQKQLEEIKAILIEATSRYQWGTWAAQFVNRWSTASELISMISPYLDIDEAEKYAIIKADSAKERGNLIWQAVLQLRESLDVRADVAQKLKDSQNQAYREQAIQKQIAMLQKELDDMDPESVSEEDELLNKIKNAGMPEAVEKEVMRVFNRFQQEGKNGHEYGSLYDYLDFVTSLSWKAPEEAKADLVNARRILDEDHYGLKDIKERVLQHIAVMSLRKNQSGSILLFIGAPGTGKTSMGKSIARALDREYVRISLGGVRDEAEIRGHRRTYIGAMPGRIMEGIKRSRVMNPVLVLDEIDKLSVSYNGDPASALLEVLDPEQNNTFTDHYMNVPYDLSKALFICTANSIDEIPQPLLDRMEVIQLSGYTPVEKFHIAKKHLLRKALDDAGIEKKNLSLSDAVLKRVIDDYTMEAGVRGLKKQLDKICRNAAVELVEDKKQKVVIREKRLPDILGKKVSNHDRKLKVSVPGVVTGLAWTQAGGEILFIETTVMHGSGRIHITGQLGDVMKESAEIAVSLLKAMFYHQHLKMEDKDIHIHVPSGAVPKDGPSAGITLFTALTSLVTGVPADKELAMTGEISLRGQVLPIGGLPEKLMAADRAGIRKVLIPKENEEDLKQIPDEIRQRLEIVPVNTVQEVISHALKIKLPKKRDTMFFESDDDFKMVLPTVQKGRAEPIFR